MRAHDQRLCRARWLAVTLGGAALVTLPHCALMKMFCELQRNAERGDAVEIASYDVPTARAQPRFSAGAAAQDITPPPGYPTGGHGPAGGVARGYWMRLQAKAFFFEDRSGRAIALVSADLFAIPAGLHAKVARLAAEELSRTGLAIALPPEALILAATHTHQGPGNFMTARIYNQFGSSYSGFAPELLDFLARQIARAVVDAARDARAHLEPVELSVHVQRGNYALVRNRSPRTFTLNRNRDELLATLNAGVAPRECRPLPGEPLGDWDDLAECPRLRAIDRTLTIVKVARTGGPGAGVAAVLLFFAAHPTVLEADTPFYSSDFVGYAATGLQQRLGEPGRPVVVGFFNGAEGDVVTRRTRRDLRDAMKLGAAFKVLAEKTLALRPERVLRDPEIHVRAGVWHPLEEKQALCGSEARLAERPMFGAPALGGGEDDRTVLHQLGWSEGIRDRPRQGQGVKLPALDSQLVRAFRFSEEFAPKDTFPDTIPLVLADLGDLRLAAVPAELTTAQGYAIRHRLGSLPHGRLEIIGLANEYVSYCSSADEYAAQDYMGASTLWGPQEGPYLECRLAELAAGGERVVAGRVDGRSFWPGATPIERFGPAFTGDLQRPDEGLEKVLRDARGLPARHLPWFTWEEPLAGEAEGLKPQNRRVAIWQSRPGGWEEFRPGPGDPPEDDRGAGFLTLYLGGGRWAALWVRGLKHEDAGTFAFVAATPQGEVKCSEPFSLAPHSMGPDRVAGGRDCGMFKTTSR